MLIYLYRKKLRFFGEDYKISAHSAKRRGTKAGTEHDGNLRNDA